MSASDTGGGSFRHKVRKKLDNLRRKSWSSSENANAASDLNRDLDIHATGPSQSADIECSMTGLEAEQETAISAPRPSGDHQRTKKEDIQKVTPSMFCLLF